ncbi:MAG: DnaB-like helicase C-terminal domain-containing protein [Nanoarchaeota archaeon]
MSGTISAHKEQIFWHYILDEPIYLNTTKPEYFSNNVLKELFDIAKDHSLRYKKAPTRDQMEELVRLKGLDEKYSNEILESLYNVKQKLEQYDKEWLEQNIGPWIKVRNLEHVIRKSIAFMKTSSVNAENASEVVENIRHMLATETAIDFSFNLGTDFFDPLSHKQTRLARSSTGYDFIDLCMKGGYWKGSLVGFLGGPKSGKSLWLANLAARSVKMGHNTAYITLELQEELVHMRIGSNLLNVPIDDYEKLTEDQDLLRKKLNKLKEDSFTPMGNLYVAEFPSSTASVNDIRSHLKKAEEILGYKFDNIFIDYINIMKNWRNPNTENTYMKIKQISEDLRAMAMQEQWAIITVTQTNRGGWETSDLNITNVSESAALIHTVDMLFGIITNAEMKAKQEYFLKCLANRVAGYENTRKRFIVNWKYARIDEDKDSQIQDMDFIINNVVGGQTNRRGSEELNQSRASQEQPSIHAVIGSNVDPDKLGGSVSVTGSELF